MQVLFWFTQVLLFIAGTTAIVILIPQIISVHRNKYSDNSSIYLYVIYSFCSLLWIVYQTTFNIYFFKTVKEGDSLTYVLLWFQLAIDIATFLIGAYTLMVKWFYFKNKYIKDVLKVNLSHHNEKVANNKKIMIPALIKTINSFNHLGQIKNVKKLKAMDMMQLSMELVAATKMATKNDKNLVKVNNELNQLIKLFAKSNNEQYLLKNIHHKIYRLFIKNNQIDTNKISFAIAVYSPVDKASWLSRSLYSSLFITT